MGPGACIKPLKLLTACIGEYISFPFSSCIFIAYLQWKRSTSSSFELHVIVDNYYGWCNDMEIILQNLEII